MHWHSLCWLLSEARLGQAETPTMVTINTQLHWQQAWIQTDVPMQSIYHTLKNASGNWNWGSFEDSLVQYVSWDWNRIKQFWQSLLYISDFKRELLYYKKDNSYKSILTITLDFIISSWNIGGSLGKVSPSRLHRHILRRQNLVKAKIVKPKVLTEATPPTHHYP